MVYKRYIKRGGKTFGPYYYESYRDANGITRTRLVSDKKNSFGKIFALFLLIVLVLMACGFTLVGNAEDISVSDFDFGKVSNFVSLSLSKVNGVITGFSVDTPEEVFKEEIEIVEESGGDESNIEFEDELEEIEVIEENLGSENSEEVGGEITGGVVEVPEEEIIVVEENETIVEEVEQNANEEIVVEEIEIEQEEVSEFVEDEIEEQEEEVNNEEQIIISEEEIIPVEEDEIVNETVEASNESIQNETIQESEILSEESFSLFAEGGTSIPQTLNLHGRLTNSAGSALNGTYNLTFKIYDDAIAGSVLYSKINQSVSLDSSGVYSTVLTNVNLSFSEANYLGITVDGDSEMTPRINLSSSPYAFRAEQADNLTSTNNYAMKNLTLSDKITFALGEIIDNLVDGWIKITGGLNVSQNIYTDENVTADYFFGDGSQLTGISGGNLSFNETYTDGKYAPNTTAGIQDLINSTGVYSTYNSTYDAKISMNYTNLALTNETNVFDGNQNFTGNISSPNAIRNQLMPNLWTCQLTPTSNPIITSNLTKSIEDGKC